MTNNLKETKLKQYSEDLLDELLIRYESTKELESSKFGEELDKVWDEFNNWFTTQVSALINQKEKELLEKFEEIVGEDEPHPAGTGRFEMLEKMERNSLRSQQRDRIKQLKEELNKKGK